MTQRLLEVPRLKDSTGFHRLLRQGLHLPDSFTDRVVSVVKILRNPRDRRRRLKARMDLEADPGSDRVSKTSGDWKLAPATLPGQAEATARTQQIFSKLAAGGALLDARSRTNKPFLINLRRDRELMQVGEIADFVLSPAILEAATRYLGSAPVLTTLRLWWTPANSTLESSQLYHRDAEGPTQLKFFLHISDVTSRSGPLVYVPADVSRDLMRSLGYQRGKLSDEALEDLGVSAHAIAVTGEAGTALALDTSRCLHFGSRGNEEDRVVLMFQFTPSNCPRAVSPSWLGALPERSIPLSGIQRLALNLVP